MKLSLKSLSCGAVAFIACSSWAQAKDSAVEASCRNFVQSFYAWYVPPAKSGVERSSDDALKLKKGDFDAELRRALKEDSDAQAKVPGEIVGLDMDPFLNTNAEPYEHYTVGKVTANGANYWAEVFGTTKGKKTDKPVVTPELSYKDKHWQFVNFHYGKSEFPQNESLLTVLKALKESRAKDAK
ncbi:MAG: hypothetical protein JST01_01185 [Cyanobacteria bacterium SZAS TMP-1]|nr:hypothetical protein [Cyanobacteria bacterium SZAS TMP-1]